VHPALLALCVAAGGLAFVDRSEVGVPERAGHGVQFLLGLDLETEMVQPRRVAELRDREVHTRVLEHPFRVVVVAHGRLRAEQRAVERDRLLQIFDGQVDVKAFHADFSRYPARKARPHR
jgi:hypothetical protein